MTQYVLYNTCFGGLTFNREFLLSLFKFFPPDTPEGQKFFPEIINDSNIDVDDNGNIIPFYKSYLEYKPRKIINLKTKATCIFKKCNYFVYFKTWMEFK